MVIKVLLATVSVLAVFEFFLIRALVKKVRSLQPRYHKIKVKGLNTKYKKLTEHIDNMDGVEFEQTCVNVLYLNGFNNIRVTAKSGDYGIDILCEKDKKKYAIQCKCYTGNIGVDAVEEAFAGCAYYKYDIPVVLTNRYFTDNAQEMARVIGVELWSRNWLVNAFKVAKRNYKKGV